MSVGMNKALLFFCLLHKCLFVHSKWFINARNSKYLPCNESITKRDGSGTIDFYGQYPVTDYCIFITSFDNSLITVSFKRFNIGYEDRNGNCSDYVEISSSQDELSKKYCGYFLPPAYHAIGGEVWVRIHREKLWSKEFLSLHYSVVPSCNGDAEIASYSFVTSPNYPKRETSYTHCQRKLSAQNSQMQIQITERDFYFGKNELKIYDGQDMNAPLLASFNDSLWSDEKEVIYTTSGHHAVIVYTNGEGASSRFNATVKIKGYCIPGTYSCGDGINCFNHDQKCNSNRDCSNGYDELGCHGCPPSRFWCGMLDKNCYAQEQFCDGMKNCEANNEDEKYCETCKPGSFLCKSENRCIYERWRCDGDFDCDDGSDEKGCGHEASRRVITAAIIGSLVCSLLLVIALGCTCKLYSLRASHHRYPLYRATPLTRVEREIFQRQAPPTYDMTVSGPNGENASNVSSRHQRRRRNRSRRRYQFQRSMPSSSESSQGNSRTSGEFPANSTANEASTPLIVSNPNNSQTTMEDFLAGMIIAFPQTPVPTQGTDPSSQVATRDSGTQTNSNSPPSSFQSTPRGSTSEVPGSLPPAPSNNSSDRPSHSRSERSSSRSRSRRRGGSSNSNSKEKQAKPLPAKKKIKPVFASAPCPDSLVEDTLTCVYPCPPSYSQAISHTPESSTQQPENASPEQQVTVPEASPDPVLDPVLVSQSPNVKPKFNFPFSLGQVIKNMATSPFSKFQKNPYSQMEIMDNNLEEIKQFHILPSLATSIATNLGELETSHRQNRSSASSTDDSLIDIAIMEETASYLDQAISSSDHVTSASSMTKEFPSQRTNRNLSSRSGLSQIDDRNAVELSDLDNESPLP